MDKKKTIINRIIDHCETLSLDGLKWNFAGILSLLLFLSMLFQENNSSIRRCKWMFIPIILYRLFKRPSLIKKKTVSQTKITGSNSLFQDNFSKEEKKLLLFLLVFGIIFFLSLVGVFIYFLMVLDFDNYHMLTAITYKVMLIFMIVVFSLLALAGLVMFFKARQIKTK